MNFQPFSKFQNFAFSSWAKSAWPIPFSLSSAHFLHLAQPTSFPAPFPTFAWAHLATVVATAMRALLRVSYPNFASAPPSESVPRTTPRAINTTVDSRTRSAPLSCFLCPSRHCWRFHCASPPRLLLQARLHLAAQVLRRPTSSSCRASITGIASTSSSVCHHSLKLPCTLSPVSSSSYLRPTAPATAETPPSCSSCTDESLANLTASPCVPIYLSPLLLS